jgi:hypothetical protein
MQAYKLETTLAQDGTLTLDNLPFQAGDRVQVIVRAQPKSPSEAKRYPLRGLPVHYDRPTEPVAEDDWEVLP